MRTPISILLALLLLTASASANYTVRIEGDTCICVGMNYQANVTIEPDDPGNESLIGGFNLAIAHDPDVLGFLGATAGSFLTGCGPSCTENCAWEYFTYRHWDGYSGCCVGCSQVSIVQLTAIADMNNGSPIDASCSEPTQKSTLAEMTFSTPPDNGLDSVFEPLNFYWRPGSDSCGDNTVSEKSGDTLFLAASVVDASGDTLSPLFNCGGPPPSCYAGAQRPVKAALDFQGGGVTFAANERGDLNLNGLGYEVSDAVLLSNFFIYGEGVFSSDTTEKARQIAASDMNCDDIVLTIADLVFNIRVITGDASPSDVCPPCPSCEPAAAARVEQRTLAAASLADTLAFFGAEGEPGEERVPFYIYMANSQDVGGVQARMVFDTAYLSPHFDTAVGDGESIEYNLLSRASEFASGERVSVKSREPGVILINLLPNLAPPVSKISTGSGVILRVYMDVNPPPLSWQPSPVEFVTEGYHYNMFSGLVGNVIWPTLVGGEFEVDYGIPPVSCPVLFSHNGSGFVQNDPLLTACEESGYHDVVTDYYHLPAGVDDENGSVRFQLREMEDEITYLDKVELITVDHAIATRVAVGTAGQIATYTGLRAPLSAVDHTGTDRIREIAAMDGVLYSSDEPGHLVLTFPNTGDGYKGYHLPSALKSRICQLKITSPDRPAPEDIGSRYQSGNRVTVEILDNDGVWQQLPAPPPRDVARQEAIVSSMAGEIDAEVITIRISWDNYYTADAVSQFEPADETPIVSTWTIAEHELYSIGAATKTTPDIGAGRSLVLTKGDVYEFSFAADVMMDNSLSRDYVIRAVGRYQPDYSVHTGLVPNEIALYDNYPNPFNASTVISFDLPAATHVKLVVINMLGQTVATLVDQEMSAGHQQAEWTTTPAIASGIYFYRLTTDQYEQTRKMVLMK